MIGHITDPSVEGGIARRELSEPDVESHDTLVEVRAYSVNRGRARTPRAASRGGGAPARTSRASSSPRLPTGPARQPGARVTGHAGRVGAGPSG
jgi:hypothetical protein